MTTFAAVMGAVPLAIGMGATGADMRQPIGICVAGGLIFSQVVTLYITPVYYVYLDRFGSFVGRLMARIFSSCQRPPSGAAFYVNARHSCPPPVPALH